MPLVITVPREYVGKFIARIRDKIIAHGDNIIDVINAVKEKGLDPREVIVDYIPEEEVLFVLTSS